MSFELISELTRWTARLSLLLFSLAFIYDALRLGGPFTRRIWQGFAAMQIIYFACLITYHIVIRELPPFDILNILLSIGAVMFLIILWKTWHKSPERRRSFAPPIPAYILAFLFTALPITRILPPETDHPIYHYMLYYMCAVFALRIILDIWALLRRRAAAK